MSRYMAVVGTHVTLADALSERKRLFPAILQGRYPLVITAIKQSIKYFERLQDLNESGKLVEHAFKEQQKLNLPWYSTVSKMIKFWHCSVDNHASTGSQVKKQMIITFKRLAYSKLKFYNSIKTEFCPEDYLRLTQEPFKAVKDLIRLRMSSHRLHIETGRHHNKPVHRRICRCCTDVENEELLAQLPHPEVHIEDEYHILFSCEFFKDVREHATSYIKNLLGSKDSSKLLQDSSDSPAVARFIRNLMKMHHRKVSNDNKDNTDK